MITAALSPAIFTAPPFSPIKLIASPDKPTYASGEEIKLNVDFENGTSKDLVLFKVKPYSLATLQTEVYDSAGKRLLINSRRIIVQTIETGTISPRFFVVVNKHSAIPIAQDVFKSYIDPQEPGSKNPQGTPLPPGHYRAVYTYVFSKDLKPFQKPGKYISTSGHTPPGGYHFAPGAKELYDRAFAGKLTAKAEFDITG